MGISIGFQFTLNLFLGEGWSSSSDEPQKTMVRRYRSMMSLRGMNIAWN